MSLPDSSIDNLADAVSGQLGRPCSLRKVKNRPEWWIADPVFSYLNHGHTGYRVGFHLDTVSATLHFSMVHSRFVASIFKQNLLSNTLVEVLRNTERYRKLHAISWDSKFNFNKYKKSLINIANDDFADFIGLVEYFNKKYDFVKDLFPSVPNTGIGGGKACSAGNTFYLRLADRVEVLSSRTAIGEVVGLAWPLFLYLYPFKTIQKRDSSLARKMRSAKIRRSLRDTTDSIQRWILRSRTRVWGSCRLLTSSLTRSAAPTMPITALWLCESHHRATEGKLKGTRQSVLVRQIDT